ncbi:HD-GYP domain-containing protein (c-di-GMP phosphodiesterase class II) [Bacillus tianshenii]|uniref:HD-GYP domain-containing protein (C-di-GMP phosphodiesterase class II) n=1 Tax=Sutcliffiella tianshenii TaxID=1463404 RepID=A0ABS2NYL2_9BACI|nr:HD-GYP domain-containing protein (c-di-GMP phosphodiesterase class II) [Bacillus tianshenii]
MAFTIGKKGTNLEKVTFDNFDISLLSRGDGAEVMVQTITKGNIFYIYPGENPNVMEFFYILEGEVVCETKEENVKLGPHDYYTAINLEEPVHFSAVTDVMYLWIVTEPTFYQLSNSIIELTKIVEKVEARDRYTYKHNERVARYSIKIAKKMMLVKDKLENLYISSVLHDIGKINTPPEILNKPTKLTDEEFAIIKLHPLDGAVMVKDLCYEGIAQIIEQHHERLNGSGYPHGLKDEEIVLEARIIAVSDAYDAMTEDRAYRKAFSPQFAISELKRLSHTHYDYEVVNALEEILKEEGHLS